MNTARFLKYVWPFTTLCMKGLTRLNVYQFGSHAANISRTEATLMDVGLLSYLSYPVTEGTTVHKTLCNFGKAQT